VSAVAERKRKAGCRGVIIEGAVVKDHTMPPRQMTLKTLVVLSALSCLPAGRATIANKPKTEDPVIERADIVYDGGPALTPSLLFAANGDLIAHWATRGDGMPGQATQFARSSDCGKTWTKPYRTIKYDKPLTGSATSLYNLPDSNRTPGRMLCYTLELVWPGEPDQSKPNYLELAAGRKFDSYYSFSTDDGRTFSERRLLSDPMRRDDFAQGGIAKLPNGDLIWPWGHWRSQPLNGFRRSTDNGLSWSPVVRAWQDPPPGHDKPLAFNETAVAVCKEGSVVAIARVDTLRDKKFWQIRSGDNGQTWTKPRQIEIAGGSPAVYCTPKGQLWLAYRDAGVGPGLGLAVSDDNGGTWRFLYHLKDPTGELEKRFGHIRYTDNDRKQEWRPVEGIVGYPCFARLSDSRVYVVFHSQMMHRRLPAGEQVYIVGNLLRIPE
jgi:hypothetical protein